MQRTTKALIRLHGCAVWSAPLLFAYDIKHIFSWPGSNKSWGSIMEILNRLMTKPTKWPVRPAKTQINLGIHLVWWETSLCAWRSIVSLATHKAHNEYWSEWADAQADLSLCCVHRSFCWFCRAADLLKKELFPKYTLKVKMVNKYIHFLRIFHMH